MFGGRVNSCILLFVLVPIHKLLHFCCIANIERVALGKSFVGRPGLS